MTTIHFDSRFKEIAHMTPQYDDWNIKREPQFFSADLDYVRKHGGMITEDIVAGIPKSWLNDRVIVDSRVHMLMPGWYPCIPGWHLDDVPRDRSDGQPDHANPSYYAEHIAAVVGTPSLTEFVVGTLNLEDVPNKGGIIYQKWHAEIEKLRVRCWLMVEIRGDRT